MLTLKKRSNIDTRFVFVPLIFFVGFMLALTYLSKTHPFEGLNGFMNFANAASEPTAQTTSSNGSMEATSTGNTASKQAGSVSMPLGSTMPYMLNDAVPTSGSASVGSTTGSTSGGVTVNAPGLGSGSAGITTGTGDSGTGIGISVPPASGGSDGGSDEGNTGGSNNSGNNSGTSDSGDQTGLGGSIGLSGSGVDIGISTGGLIPPATIGVDGLAANLN